MYICTRVACYLYRRFSSEGYYLFSAIFLCYVMCNYVVDFLPKVSSFTFVLLFIDIFNQICSHLMVTAWNHLYVSAIVGEGWT